MLNCIFFDLLTFFNRQKGIKAMKKFNKITVMGLSAITATILCTGFAMAAEVPDEVSHGTSVVSSDMGMASIFDSAQELDLRKRLNPNITADEWEIVERFDNPEANGLVLVDETERVENGKLIVDSVYTDSAVPFVEGQNKYYAASKIFVDGTEYSPLIATAYLSATFKYDNDRFIKNVHVVDGSISNFWIKEIEGDYPQEINKCDPVVIDNEVYNFKRYSQVEYHLTLKLGLRDTQEYVTTLAVNEDGEQFRGNDILYQ